LRDRSSATAEVGRRGLGGPVERTVGCGGAGFHGRIIVVSKAYGLYLGACEHPSSAVSDRGSELLSGATVSSRMAQSRYGSAGELLAWRPDRVGHEAFMGVSQGVTPGLWQGSASAHVQ
jgi:hypothetical protein